MSAYFSFKTLRQTLLVVSIFLISIGSAEAHLFMNNNNSCEDVPVQGGDVGAATIVVGPAAGITCNRFNDDSALGNTDFPDCVTLQDPFGPVGGANLPEYSFLVNTGEHSTNECFNTGGNRQFQDAQNLANANINIVGSNTRAGSVVSGNLDNGGFADFVHSAKDPNASGMPGSMEEVFSENVGGFLNGDSTSVNIEPVSTPHGLLPIPLFFSQNLGGVPVSGNTLFSATFPGDHASILFDCNGDGLDEAAVGVMDEEVTSFPLSIMVLQNGGAGLQQGNPAADLYNLIGVGDMGGSITLTPNDFNGDGNMDLAAVVTSPGTTDYAALCLGNGSCGFTCPTQIADAQAFDLDNLCVPGDVCRLNYYPSVVSGDFDGDGDMDLATPESFVPSMQGTLVYGIRYLLNNGGDLSTWSNTRVAVPAVGNEDVFKTIVAGRFSTAAVQNQIDEVAVTYNNFNNVIPGIGANGTQPITYVPISASVQVVTTDGAQGFNAPLSLSFTPSNNVLGLGLEAQDFDHCGGDDLVAEGTLSDDLVVRGQGSLSFFEGDISSTASLFLNENEAPVVTIGPNIPADFPTGLGADLPATCTDPTLDDRSFQWTMISGPAGATVSFGTPSGNLVDPDTDATTTVVPSAAGDYVLELSCADFCGLTATAQVTITSAGAVIPGSFTQGGNFFCSLNKAGGPTGSAAGVGLLLLGLGALLAWRLRRGVLLGLLAISLVTGWAASSHALTNSVSVNTFSPTVDDSDYITVYNSPTMLKRNFHVGFFLDYAYRPYEFGNNNFDRTSGIVDHLLDANIVGSYGILDWFTIGVDIPVHLYEGLNAPVLGLNESNFALGDVRLYFKFRLLDREAHGVGIAIIPFAHFPTSTNSTDFLGDGSFGGGGLVVIDGKIGERVTLALNLGYNVRGKFIDVGGNEINDEFLASLGISGEVIKNVFRIIGELQTSTVVNNFYSSQRTTPMEGRIGFRYTWANNHDINAGVGLGMLHGIGQPAIRGFIGYTYTKRPLAEVTVPPPPMNEIQVGDELTLQDKIYFDFDRSTIRDISKPTLDKIAGFLKAHPEVTKIKIDGYTCDLGTASYNMGLSQRRANSVKNYLEAQDISPDRIGTVQGFGESNPLVPNTDEANREQNRRVQIFVEAVNYNNP